MKDLFYQILIISVVTLTIAAFFILSSYFEATSFNKLTGNNATIWDAMWTELRVCN